MSRLAIDGGEPACAAPLPTWPHYDEDEIAVVSDVLRSGKVNQWTGSKVREFEAVCATTFQQPHAIAVANGTLALELALFAAGIGPGDEVVVTPRSFMASASCVTSVGAVPVFADVDPESQNITPDTIAAVLSPKTKAIIAVHLNGWPCDMVGIMALAERHNLYVIEDCAQAHGAMIDGRPVGSFGHAAAYSFCQDKIISTGGEGGLTLFRSDDDWRRAFAKKDHGKSYDAVFNRQHSPGFRWLHESFGSNWRLTELQAAIGLRQLEKLPDWHARRRQIAMALAAAVAPFAGISVPMPNGNSTEHAWYRFSFFVDDEELQPGWDRARLMAAINAEGVRCLEVCAEIYREKAFDGLAFPTPDCPAARDLGNRVALLLVHPTLDAAAVERISAALQKVLAVATHRR
jgi:dTDP-4-amino-4,6-dideoxygalactose transaminase